MSVFTTLIFYLLLTSEIASTLQDPILCCKMRIWLAITLHFRLFGVLLAPRLMAIAGKILFLVSRTILNTCSDAIIVKDRSRIFRIAWTSSRIICSSMVGIGLKPFGLYLKASVMKRKRSKLPFIATSR